MNDPINPGYYKSEAIECIDVIEAFVPDKPYRWPVLKYLLRAGKKPGQDEVQDLRKAIWWIEREIQSIEEREKKASWSPWTVTAPVEIPIVTREPCQCDGPCTRMSGFRIPASRYCKAGSV